MAHSIGWYLSELKRRKVYRVAAVYVVVAFVIWQVADIALPNLGLPDTAVTLVLVLTILGFPLAVVLAWAYEVRPEEDRVAATSDAPVSPVVEAAPAAGGGTDVAGDAAGDRESSIAVLPFENLSSEPDTAFFADGISEEITHVLARSAGVRVVARTSAFAFKGRPTDVRDIATTLRVSHVLEGSVRRSGRRLRVTVQLVDAAAGYHVWSERFDRDLGDVFAIQDEIARQVALQFASGPQGDVAVSGFDLRRAAPRSSHTPSVAAYDAYLRGKERRAHFEPGAHAAAIVEFRAALRHDPDFALAHAAIAEASSARAIGLGFASHETMPAARAAADRALELEPELPEAHVARALVALFYDRDYPAAKRGFDRALALNPNYADAYVWSEFYWTYVARSYESALAATRRAQELSPLDASIRVRLPTVHYLFEKYDLAEAELLREVEREPASPMVHLALADTYVRTGRLDQAVVEANRGFELSGGLQGLGAPMGVTGGVRGLTGDSEGANEVLAELERRAGEGLVTSFWRAVVHAGLGDHDETFRLFEQAVDEGDCNLLYVMAAPAEFGFRTDARMPALLERLGLSHLL